MWDVHSSLRRKPRLCGVRVCCVYVCVYVCCVNCVCCLYVLCMCDVWCVRVGWSMGLLGIFCKVVVINKRQEESTIFEGQITSGSWVVGLWLMCPWV